MIVIVTKTGRKVWTPAWESTKQDLKKKNAKMELIKGTHEAKDYIIYLSSEMEGPQSSKHLTTLYEPFHFH